MGNSGESAASRQWCVAAALKSELNALRSLDLPNATPIETGVGQQNAHRSILEATKKHAIGGIIHIGFAGSLTHTLDVGDVVVAGLVEGEGNAPIALPDAACILPLLPGGVRHRSGTILTHDAILATAGEKHAIAQHRASTECVCVDMESAPVAAICAELAIPYIGLRAITDSFDEDLPLNLNECRGRDGNIDTMRVMWAAVHHPSSIAGLMELRRRAHNCADTLARCVANIVAAYPTPSDFTNAHSR